MPTPETFTLYENDHRDPELVAMMAMIDQLELLNKNMKTLIDELDRQGGGR